MLGLRSNLGKLLLDTSKRTLCPFQENVAGGDHINGVFIHRSGFNRGWAVGRQPVPGPDDTVG